MTVSSDLQDLVDAAAQGLRRAVAIDDRRLHLLAYSPHFGPVDPVRRAAILTRRIPDEAVEFLLGLGIDQAQSPVRTPEAPGLGMDARVCVPVRCQDVLFGYAWIIDREGTAGDRELELLESAAAAAGTVLYRERLLGGAERGRERELLGDLMSSEAPVRAEAARKLVDSNLFVPAAPVAVLVVRVAAAPAEAAGGGSDVAVGRGLDRLRRTLPPRCALSMIQGDHALFLAATGPAVGGEKPPDLGQRLHDLVTDALPAGSCSHVSVGAGSERERLAEAVESYREAARVCRIVDLVDTFGGSSAWEQLGVYRTLSSIPLDELGPSALHPGLLRLFDADGPDQLVRTLETYLDSGTNAKSAAAELAIHRASLYYRLGKIERIAGMSLQDGADRLVLHLGLRLARLAQLHPGCERRRPLPHTLPLAS